MKASYCLALCLLKLIGLFTCSAVPPKKVETKTLEFSSINSLNIPDISEIEDLNTYIDTRQNSIHSVKQAHTAISEILEYFKKTPVSEALGTVKKANVKKEQ